MNSSSDVKISNSHSVHYDVSSALAGILTILILAVSPFFTISSLMATYNPPL